MTGNSSRPKMTKNLWRQRCQEILQVEKETKILRVEKETEILGVEKEIENIRVKKKETKKSSSKKNRWKIFESTNSSFIPIGRTGDALDESKQQPDKFGYCIAPDKNIEDPDKMGHCISRTTHLTKYSQSAKVANNLWMPQNSTKVRPRVRPVWRGINRCEEISQRTRCGPDKTWLGLDRW
jgi:hypothetical protein